jgi:photosystem II stability/assembly factor-like uncharacterized protein
VVGTGTILVTNDGGNHWNARRLEDSVSFRAIKVRKGGTAAWIVGDSSSIWATINGGQTWQKTKNPNSQSPFLGGLCFDEQGERGWAVGDAGSILRTINGGTSWSVQNGGTKAFLYSVSCASDGQRGWAVGNNNVVISTSDGGDHWYPVSLQPTLAPIARGHRTCSLPETAASARLLRARCK